LPDHSKGAANFGGAKISAAWYDGINHATQGSEAKPEANDNSKKPAGSLLLGSLLPGCLFRYLLHAAKLIKMRGWRQCRNIKKVVRPAAPMLQGSA